MGATAARAWTEVEVSRQYATVAAAVVLLWAVTAAACGSGEDTNAPAAASPEPAVRVSGSGTALPLVQKLGEAYLAENPSAQLQFDAGTNSSAAIRGVLQHTLELAVANRQLSEAEAAEPLEEHPFARDATAFAVHLPSLVSGLTTAQVRDIYAGRLTDWSQLGGPAGAIVVLDRDKDESMRKLVLVPVLGADEVTPQAVVLTRAGDMVTALQSTPGSVGYTSAGLVHVLGAPAVRALPLDGVKPDAESVAQGTYPWYLTFRLIEREDAPPEVRRFVEFVLGPKGKQVLEQYGYAVADN